MKKSVVIAAYNGGAYIGEQLASILPQLDAQDEVLISDDLPSGDTKAAVTPLCAADKRVRYLEGPGRGVVKNFEFLLTQATGDVIFLCDQDDVWLPDKVSAVTRCFPDARPRLVLHDAKVTDAELRVTDASFFRLHGTRAGFWRNWLRNSYMGCCMALSRSLLPFALPFPDDLPMHDQWLGLIAERCGEVTLIDTPLLLYRRHGKTVTGKKTSAKQKLIWRLHLLRDLGKRKQRGA